MGSASKKSVGAPVPQDAPERHPARPGLGAYGHPVDEPQDRSRRARAPSRPAPRSRCRYIKKEMSGNSPKFTCVIPPEDEVKVKFGRDNGEVYAEVAATRLFWALGFPVDRMYPVRVLCDGCPPGPEAVRARAQSGADCSIPRRSSASSKATRSRPNPSPVGHGPTWTRSTKPRAARRARSAMRSSCSPCSFSTPTTNPRSSASCASTTRPKATRASAPTP